MKKLIAAALSIILLLSSLVFGIVAYADDITYSFDSTTQTLYINGSGEMDDYISQNQTPWAAYITSTKTLVIAEGITYLGDYAFCGFTKLASVSLPESLTSMGEQTFASCRSLMSLEFTSNFILAGDTSFAFSDNAQKSGFVLTAPNASYALSLAFTNKIPFVTNTSGLGAYDVNIVTKGTKVVYKYVPNASGTYTFTSTGKHDTVARLYDSSLKQIAYNDDASGSNTNFKLTAKLTKGEEYYFVANILNSSITGNFAVELACTSFSATVLVNAMLNPSGEASDFVVSDATVNGTPVGNGYELTSATNEFTCTVNYNGITKTVTFTPESDSFMVVIPTCDVNADGYVNAKDYSIMRSTNSDHLQFYNSFINYKL